MCLARKALRGQLVLHMVHAHWAYTCAFLFVDQTLPDTLRNVLFAFTSNRAPWVTAIPLLNSSHTKS
jgi:hypothetical protein